MKFLTMSYRSYRNIMRFQISKVRETRKRDTGVIKIRIRKVFNNHLCFIRCSRQHLRAVELRWYSRLAVVDKTIGDSPKVTRDKLLGSYRLFCFISISKFGSFKNPFVTITNLLEIHFRCRRIVLLVQAKEVISMTMPATQTAEIRGDG